MGDRVSFVFKGTGRDLRGNEAPYYSPAVYIHWGGSDAANLLERLREHMGTRHNDPQYTAARCAGLAHEDDNASNISLGIFNVSFKGELKPGKKTNAASPGDAGLLVVDVTGPVWTVDTFFGYGLENKNFTYAKHRRENMEFPGE